MGKVYLVGAGPGAVDLLTVRAARLLGEADIVFHDALIGEDVLSLAPRAEKVAVGKRCGAHSTTQRFINKRLVDAAAKHDVVVRLKGGDPMLFGRAQEEIDALEAAGVDVEVVPGITAALAASADLKRSLTKRGVARSVAFFTSSTAPDQPDHPALPETDTLVQYMGGREAAATAERLMAEGRRSDLPVVVVENCSRADQRVRRLTLADLAHGLDVAHGPVLVMIGEAMAPRDNQVL